MKEFNKWFKISFSFRGYDFEHTIHLNQVDVDEYDSIWADYFNINVKEDTYRVEVFGTYDDDGNVRTTGTCLVNGEEKVSSFGINILDDYDDIIDIVDDIDIIDAD